MKKLQYMLFASGVLLLIGAFFMVDRYFLFAIFLEVMGMMLIAMFAVTAIIWWLGER